MELKASTSAFLLENSDRALEATSIEIFDARKSTLEGEIEVLQQRKEQLRSQIDGLLAFSQAKSAFQSRTMKNWTISGSF